MFTWNEPTCGRRLTLTRLGPHVDGKLAAAEEARRRKFDAYSGDDLLPSVGIFGSRLWIGQHVLEIDNYSTITFYLSVTVFELATKLINPERAVE